MTAPGVKIEPKGNATMSAVVEHMPASPVAFDYGGMSGEEARELREVAERVRARHRQQVAGFIDTGRDLAAVKERLGHGQFGAWCAAEFQWTDRTARNYLAAFEAFGSKTETVSDLPPTTVYKLATAPEPIREKVLKLREVEHLPADRVREVLADEIEAERQAKADAKKTPEQRKKEQAKAARMTRERAELRVKYDAEKAARQAANSNLAVMLIDALGENLPAIADALAGTDFEHLASWLEMPYGWTYVSGSLVRNPPPSGAK